MVEIAEGARERWREVAIVDARRAGRLFGDRPQHRFVIRHVGMRVERIQGYAIPVGRVRDRARLRRPESFADEDQRFARLRLIAEPPRKRLQCRRYHLRARRFSRLWVAAHEVALELGARRVITGVPLEACDDLAYERAILREGDRVEWIQR